PGATVRPISSSTSEASRMPKPPPPTSSGRAMPTSPALASSAHRSRSNHSGDASISLRRSWVTLSPRIWAASFWISCCSSENEKSIALQTPGHLEAEHGDEVALHLVGSAAEGEDERPLVRPLEAAPQARLGRA